MSPKLRFSIGDKVKWVWYLECIEGEIVRHYMEGVVVGIYGYDGYEPVTVDTESKIGRVAHRPWNLTKIGPS
jgi:hypothetical protein